MARSCCTTLVSRRTGNLPSVGARPASFYFACGGAGLRKLILDLSTLLTCPQPGRWKDISTESTIRTDACKIGKRVGGPGYGSITTSRLLLGHYNFIDISNQFTVFHSRRGVRSTDRGQSVLFGRCQANIGLFRTGSPFNRHCKPS